MLDESIYMRSKN